MSLAADRWRGDRLRMRREKLHGGCRGNDLMRRRSEPLFNVNIDHVGEPAVSRFKPLLKQFHQE